MTVSTTKTFKSGLLGNGSTTQFPFDFPAASAAEVAVYVNGVRSMGGYTVSLSPSVGGTVAFDTAPAGGASILIESDPTFLQDSSFGNEGPFRPSTFDAIHDRFAIGMLWLRDRALRSITLARGKSGDAGGILPGQFLVVDAGGNAAGASGTGNDAALRTDLAAPGGSSLVGWLRGATGAVARALTAKLFGYVDVEDFGAAGDGITDDTAAWTAAIDYVKARGLELRAMSTTYLVSTLTFDGAGYAVETTAGNRFKQKPELTGDGNLHPIWNITGERIRFGDATFEGNIASDSDEYSHAVAIISAKDVALGHLHGENIRGDVVYAYGRASSEAEKCYGISIAGVTGDNVLRDIFSAVGGQGRVGYVRRVGTGRVGYKDIDIEPNEVTGTLGDYQAPDWEFGHIHGATVQVVSADPDVMIKSVRFGSMDLDGSRIANSTPAYSGHPGTNDFAISLGRISSFDAGDFTLANYDFSPVQFGDSVGRFAFKSANFSNVARTDATYGAVFLHLGDIRPQVLECGLIEGTLYNNTRMIFRSDSQFLNLNVGKINVTGGIFGSRVTGHVEQITLDCGDPVNGIVFNNCDGIDFGTGTITNTASAWGFSDCQRVKLTDFVASFGAGLDFTGGGVGPSQDIIAFSSDINGMNVPGVNFLLGGAVHVGGTKVVAAQQAPIAAPAGGTTVDSEARASISALLAAARAHGLIAT